jgi:signal transduction histidine kinase
MAIRFSTGLGNDRAFPILALGFGVLISLIGLTGIGALRQSQALYRDFTAATDRYRRTERALDTLATGLYEVGLLTRDYLLERSNLRSAQYRQQVVAQRAGVEQAFRDLQAATEGQDRDEHERLRIEVGAYWNAIDPIFDWTPEEKLERSSGFIRQQILPRREAALAIARELEQFTRTAMIRERGELDRRHDEFLAYVRRMLGGAVLIGLAIALVAVVLVGRLEAKSREEHRRTEAAERELRRLSQQLVHSQEQERKSISRELHDEVGQTLTGLRMELRSIQELRNAPEPEFIEHLESAKRLTEQSVRALKDIAMGLRPSMLDDLGLGSAVQWQARQFARQIGVPVNLQLDGLDGGVPEPVRTCAYRLVQEALTNCARHSRATAVNVAICKSATALTVSVKDNGIGFDTAARRREGLGLLGIEERVHELGGTVKIQAQPHAGAAVYAVIPLVEEEGKHADSDSAG